MAIPMVHNGINPIHPSKFRLDMKLLSLGLVLATLLSFSGAARAAELGYYQWPTLASEQLVFASEGDLWRTTLSTDGVRAAAVRLTTHAEEETHPVLSPDGQWLAFVARYESAGDIYVMPATGGAPRRLTHEGGGVASVGWYDSEHLLYVSGNVPGPRAQEIRRLNVVTGVSVTLPLAGMNAATRGDGGLLFFSRYGLVLSQDNAVQYRGGRMAQLWRWQEAPSQERDSRARRGSKKIAEAERLLTNFGAPIRAPMWWNNRVYFVSDASGADNFWSVASDGSDVQQHTEFARGQLHSPQLNQGRIVFQRGADLMLWAIGAARPEPLEIQLVSDRDQLRPRALAAPLEYLDSSRIGAGGESVVLTARGHIAQAYPGSRRRIEYGLPAAARARGAVATEMALYAIVDHNLYSEIWRFPANGVEPGQVIVSDVEAHIWSLQPSPDGQRLVFDDKRGRLWSLDLKSQRKSVIATNVSSDDHAFFDFAWSPAGRYLAFAQYDKQDRARVHMFDTRDRRDEIVSSAKYEARAPAFSHDGKWLYFNTDRHFEASPGSPWGDRNLGTEFDKRGRLFALQLTTDAVFPFAPDAESLSGGSAKKSKRDSRRDSKRDSKKDDEDAKPEDAKIEFDGLTTRLWPLPVAPDNVVALAANKQFLYLLVTAGDGLALKSIKIERVAAGAKAETKDVTADVSAFGLSNDGKTLFVQTGKDAALTMLLVPAEAELPKDVSANTVRIEDWQLRIDPADEWRQQLRDVWRMHRDFAYDPDLRGLDWLQQLRDTEALLPRIGSRFELNSLIKQMIAPLGILHSQIRAGEVPKDAETAAPAYLGAVVTPADAGLQLETIYAGETDLPEMLGPLLQPGVDVIAGDVLRSVNGHPTRSVAELTHALAGKAGQQVRLEYVRGRDARSALVVPVDRSGNRKLRYGHWVQANATKVATLGDEQLGYVHLEAMTSRDIASFARDFYAQLDKDGIIIDVRGNRGGNVDSWILNALMRRVWAFWESPAGGRPFGNMQQAYRGHLVVLVNEGTYSDGETFAAGVKALGVTDLIGTRTAGAGIWLTGRNHLSDNGMARIAELPQFGLDGRWLIEGRGVDPDIEVVNLPVAEFAGEDAQLTAGVRYLQRKIVDEPIPRLRAAPLPPVGTSAEDVQADSAK